MDDALNCPRPLARADAVALIGILANLNGMITVQAIDGADFEAFRARAEEDGYIPPQGGHYELRQALEDLTQRVRYVLGEYDHRRAQSRFTRPQPGSAGNPPTDANSASIPSRFRIGPGTGVATSTA
ncbi:hypothetical protein SAMN04489806_1022 [Paramicrobacterium humi]|uniref:Uncharacterized protein n=1 Tax=Paramicrobacterium humi TaxID=640635 RepID=A0A1H4K5B9_9MICO|nr:hypothetical protein SAMN04489806_1022 [Microbacterium humi]